MPLVKSSSKNAFRRNVATEVKAGKPPKQAVAIAYATKRAAKKGGMSKKSGKCSSTTLAYRAAKDTQQADIRSVASVSNALKMLPWRGIKPTQIKQDSTAKHTAKIIQIVCLNSIVVGA